MRKNTILIIDDDKNSSDLFKNVFENDYDVQTCFNGKDALEYLTKHHKEVAVIILDLTMPVIDGGVLLKVLNKKGITKIIPVIIATSERGLNRVQDCFDNGALDVILKPFNPIMVKGHVKNVIELYETKMNLQAKVHEQTYKIQAQNEELKKYNSRIVEVMSTVVEFRNLESGDHIKRIKKMTRVMAEICQKLFPDVYNLSNEDVEMIESASALHDIGKITISDAILLKPGRLSSDEFELIKSHTTGGCEILNEIQDFQDEKSRKISYNIVRHHHERYDGKGYPDSLVGEAIPIEAQLVSIVDAYEALVGERVYRDAFSKDKAYNMIMNGECGEFSDNVLTCFEKARPELEKIASSYERKY